MFFPGASYSLFGLLGMAVSIYFAVHAYRTGRYFWIWILIFVPMVGSLIYLFAEYLPSVRAGRVKLDQVGRRVVERINPAAEVRRLEDQVAINPSVDHRLELAAAYLRAGRTSEGLAMIRACMSGVHAEDPKVLSRAARALFEAGYIDEATDAMNRFSRAEPRPTQEMRILRARMLEEVGEVDAALREYQLLTAGAGEEGRARYGLLLRRLGREAEADAVFDQIVRHARLSSGAYRREQKEWIDLAQREIRARAGQAT
jgi:hypothetical protein